MQTLITRRHQDAKTPSRESERTFWKSEEIWWKPLDSLGGMHLGSGSGGRLDFLEMRQRTQAGWLDIAGAAAGSGKHRKSGNNECGEYADHGMDGGWGKICAVRRNGQMELIWWESRRSACSERERRSGHRMRRKARQTRRSGRLSSVKESGLFLVNHLIGRQVWG